MRKIVILWVDAHDVGEITALGSLKKSPIYVLTRPEPAWFPKSVVLMSATNALNRTREQV